MGGGKVGVIFIGLMKHSEQIISILVLFIQINGELLPV